MADRVFAGVDPLAPGELWATRDNLDAFAAGVAVAPGTRIEERAVGGRPGLRVVPASGGGAGAVLLLHGGGFRAGSPHAARGVASFVAAAADVEVLLPAYRLAPESPFPAAVHDVVRALGELVERGTAPERIAVVGESAGGGLAVAGLLAARRAGLPRPAALVALSPWLDLTASSGSYDRCAATDRIIDRAGSLRSALAYLDGADPRDPLASPLFADDEALAALPPSLVQASTDEVLVDDAARFVSRVRDAGGASTLQTWSGAPHLWHVGVPGDPAAVDAVRHIGLFLEKRYG